MYEEVFRIIYCICYDDSMNEKERLRQIADICSKILKESEE